MSMLVAIMKPLEIQEVSEVIYKKIWRFSHVWHADRVLRFCYCFSKHFMIRSVNIVKEQQMILKKGFLGAPASSAGAPLIL